MNKKRALLVVMCCALAGAFFVMPLGIVRASTWTITFDGGDPLPWEVSDISPLVNGTVTAIGNPGNALQGRTTTENSTNPAGTTSTYITITLPTVSTVTAWSADIKRVASGGATTSHASAYYYDESGTLITSAGGSNVYFLNAWGTSTKSTSIANVKSIMIGTADTSYPSMYVAMDNVTVTATSIYAGTPTATYTPSSTPDPSLLGWGKPLRSADQSLTDTTFHPARIQTSGSFSGLAFNDIYNLNVGFTAAAGVNVFAIAAGTITSVEPFSCNPLLGTESICELIWLDMPISRYGIQTIDTYFVTETLINGQFIRYQLTTPLVTVGDTVSSGCLLGTAPNLYDYFGNKLGGALLIQGIESDSVTAFDLSSKLINEPSGIACKTAVNSSCPLVANPTFLAALGAWQIEPGSAQTYIPYLVPDGGVFFPLSIGQVLNLDAAASYRIQLIYEVQANSPIQHITVSLGNTDTEIYLKPTVDKTTYTIPADTYTPDLSAGLYSFRIKGEADADRTTLYFACVQDTTDSIPVPGDGCIVLDGNFNQSYTDSPWSVSGAPDPPAVIPGGMAVIPDGGFISQSITLYPGAAGANVNYDLLVTYRRQGIASAGKDVLLSWEFGSASGDLTPASESQLWADYTATFGVATNVVTDDLILTATGSDSVQAAQVKSVCIHTHDGGTPPGYRDPLPFTGGCRFCVYSPVGDLTTDFSEFQQWLACQFFQLWECQAKILLRYIWTTLANILTLFGFFRLWLSAVLINLVTWGNGNLTVFAQWLYGQINNAAQEIVYAILSTIGGAGGGGTNMWDFLIALIGGIFGLLQVFVQLVANIMQLIISGVIGFLVNGVGLLLGLLQSVINGLNTAPATINAAWLPNCNDATSGLFVVCSAIYGVEAGLAIGPFAYLVPIGIGLGALNLLWWGIAKIKGVFAE